jgi:hypothetical protein
MKGSEKEIPELLMGDGTTTHPLSGETAQGRVCTAVELCHQIAAVKPGSRLRLDRRLIAVKFGARLKAHVRGECLPEG